jgi:hypothetical protein
VIQAGIRDSAVPFGIPPPDERPARVIDDFYDLGNADGPFRAASPLIQVADGTSLLVTTIRLLTTRTRPDIADLSTAADQRVGRCLTGNFVPAKLT